MVWWLLMIPVLFLCYLFCIAPRTGRRSEMLPFAERYIAHRGLFDNGGEAPENSIVAFRRAVEKGYGIELDVQQTIDGKLVVFHDESLRRMCGVKKKLHLCTFEELQQYRLAGSEERIPLFTEVLAVIGGRVPLIVEIKSEGDWRGTTRRTAEVLDRYAGVYCVESFHPLVVRWFRRHRPAVLRGQLSTDFLRDRSKRPMLQKIALTWLLTDVLARPDFIGYKFLYADQPSLRLTKRMGAVMAGWTIRSEAELAQAGRFFEVIIFDGFTPDFKRFAKMHPQGKIV